MNDYAIDKWYYEFAKNGRVVESKKFKPRKHSVFGAFWRTREDSNLWPTESEWHRTDMKKAQKY